MPNLRTASINTRNRTQVTNEEFDIVGATYYAVAPAGYVYSQLQTEFYGTRKYNSLAAAEAALPTSPTTPLVINILGTWASPDTTSVAFSGTTTSTTNYIKVRAIGQARHSGKWTSTAYRLEVPYTVIAITDKNIRIEGIQVWSNLTNGGDQNCIQPQGATVFDILIEGCLFRGYTSNTQSYHSAFQQWSQAAGSVVTFRNCVSYDFAGGTMSSGFLAYSGTGVVNMENCTAVNCDHGFYTNTASMMKANNCLAQNCTDGFFGTFKTGSGHNVSDIAADAPGTNSFQASISFVDAANGDFNIAGISSSLVKGKGAPLSGFSTDAAGNYRGTRWDIGALIAPEYNQEEFDVVGATYYAVAEAGYVYSDSQTDFYETRKYNTLSAAEAAIPGATFTAPVIINILGEWVSPDTTGVTFSGYRTSETNYLKIRTIREARHNGVWSDTAYRLLHTSEAGLTTTLDFIYIQGLQFKKAGTGKNTGAILCRSTVALWYTFIEFCILDGSEITGDSFVDGVQVYNTYIGLCYIINCIAYDYLCADSAGFINWDSDSYVFVFYSTVNNCTAGYWDHGGIIGTYGCLAQNCTDGFTGVESSSDFCCSDLSSDAPGPNSFQASALFRNSATKDFRLNVADSVMRRGGIPEFFTIVKKDIKGVKRTRWDVGADEGALAAISYDHYISLNGTSDYISTPDSTANSVTGSIDIRVKAAATDWTPASEDDWIAFVSKWNTVGGQGAFEFCHRSSGSIYLAISENGTAYSDYTSQSAVSFSDGEPGWVRATFNASNGQISFYESNDYNPNDESGTWSSLGGGTIAPRGIFNSSHGIDIGRVFWSGLSADLFNGKIYYVEIRDGIDGPIVAKFNASEIDSTETYISNINKEEKWTNNGGTYTGV